MSAETALIVMILIFYSGRSVIAVAVCVGTVYDLPFINDHNRCNESNLMLRCSSFHPKLFTVLEVRKWLEYKFCFLLNK